jgi:hypothetical protein
MANASRQAGFFSIAAIAAASALTVCSSISTQARAPLLPILTESTYLQDVENELQKRCTSRMNFSALVALASWHRWPFHFLALSLAILLFCDNSPKDT